MHSEFSQKLDAALYIVATPIGNLKDITLRALDTLQNVDVIAAEDTRNTAHLLKQHQINAKKLIAAHQHNERGMADKLIGLIQSGQSVALVTDAGTPAISDPGSLLVQQLQLANVKVVPIPGACAVVTALSAAGFPNPHFLFYGFLPNKAASRCNEISKLQELSCTLVFYEAPHRVIDCVVDLLKVLGGEREIVFARELTKLFETIHRCKLSDALAWLQHDPNQQRGEFVLLISGAIESNELPVVALQTLKLLLNELPLKQAVSLTSQITGQARNSLYQLALSLKDSD